MGIEFELKFWAMETQLTEIARALTGGHRPKATRKRIS